jgi:hypothetical protein
MINVRRIESNAFGNYVIRRDNIIVKGKGVTEIWSQRF